MAAFLRWLDPILDPMACLPPPPVQTEIPENADVLLARLEVLLRQKLKYAMAGNQKGILRGTGLDFADLREYRPGDDIRKMDWSVFARTLTPHVRDYHEEKQLTLWIVVDFTPSMRFGQQQTKLSQAIELFGLLALLAQKAGHKLGACLIGPNRNNILPPGNGPGHARHLTQKLLHWAAHIDTQESAATGDPLKRTWQELNRVAARHSTVVILSDFLDKWNPKAGQPHDGPWHLALGELSQRVKLLCLMLSDPLETALPPAMGTLCLIDPESAAPLEVDTQNSACLQAYIRQAASYQESRLQQLKTLGAATLVSTHHPPLDALLSLLNGESRWWPR
ncbi:DUF58 domain-containing protein [Vampirovibrio chlorellavorus]|uniref:DUF58 domain-containing protein n=1 Tax=Vampirovibrio chlorellavorus TaxID=758823 RepID=UPI0026EC2C5E|nr:DUF58 domain-containing protein [Vampirovibrio chlorellavorus]